MGKKYFDSEGSWPFLLRRKEMAACCRFLLASNPAAPRLLRIHGPSGGGKSFFARELLARCSESISDGVCVYVDIPPTDLEASELFGKIERIISVARIADRNSPNSVSKKIADKWRAKKNHPFVPGLGYAYRVFRDLLTLIPGKGIFIKAFLPARLPSMGGVSADPNAAFRFLVSRSRSQPIIIALDNIQFLSTTLVEILASELQGYGEQLCLVLIERTTGNRESYWTPQIPGLLKKSISIGTASKEDIAEIINRILPNEPDGDALAVSIHRRSEGNLKSAWYQLKLIAERRANQDDERLPKSYQEVIQSLSSADQMVLRFIVFLLGGLTISSLVELCKASHLGLGADTVTAAIADLTALGLVIVNGEQNNRPRVEHEIVATVVTELTPEDEKLELIAHLIKALSSVLDKQTKKGDDDALYDRLIGIVHEQEVRSRPSLQTHLVDFIHTQNSREKFSYLCNLYRDTVCWDVVDILPLECVRVLLNAIQKCSLFAFGLIAAQRLEREPRYRQLAALYSAKYLVQMFQYEDAARALEGVGPSKEKDAVEFNILANLCEDKKAATIANRVFGTLNHLKNISEYELVVLRNAGHLFPAAQSRDILNFAIRGFTRLGNRFGVATTLNNLGVVELASGRNTEAKKYLNEARDMLSALDSPEVYQPLVNLSALAAVTGDIVQARALLQSARRFAPKSLKMDMAMLDFNEAVLALQVRSLTGPELVEMFRRLHGDAAKTRDMRFIEVVAWFTASLEAQFSENLTVDYSTTIIDRVLARTAAGLELFLPIELRGKKMDAPFILSPHWRY
jgi:tetratricopeptide (TPR) repeat protein